MGDQSKVYQWLGPRCGTKKLTHIFRQLSANLTWIKESEFGLGLGCFRT